MPGTPPYRRVSIGLFLAGFATFSLLYCTQPLLPVFADYYHVSATESSLALSLSTGFLAYALEGLRPTDLALLFFQRLYYRQLMLYVLGKSIIYAIRGRLVGWGKLERKATVTSPV